MSDSLRPELASETLDDEISVEEIEDGFDSIPRRLERAIRGLAPAVQRAQAAAAQETGAAESYQLQYRQTNSTGWAMLNGNLTSCSVEIDSLEASTWYDFQISAANAAGQGPVSPVVVARTTDGHNRDPGRVVGLRAVASGATMKVSWSAPATGGTVETYRIEYRELGCEPWIPIPQDDARTTATLSCLTAVKCYEVRVAGRNNGRVGPDVCVRAATTQGIPTAPGPACSLRVIKSDQCWVELAWDAPPGGADTYLVTHQEITGARAAPAPAMVVSSPFKVDCLEPCTRYRFQVIAQNWSVQDGKMVPASSQQEADCCQQQTDCIEWTTTTGANMPPGGIAMAPIAVAASATNMWLEWTPPEEGGTVGFYHVRYRLTNSGDQWTTKAEAVTGIRTQVSGLQPAKSYDFEIVARNRSGHGAPSPHLRAQTNAAAQYLPGAVTDLIVAKPTARGFVISWDAPSVSGAIVPTERVAELQAKVSYLTARVADLAITTGSTMNQAKDAVTRVGAVEGGLANIGSVANSAAADITNIVQRVTTSEQGLGNVHDIANKATAGLAVMSDRVAKAEQGVTDVRDIANKATASIADVLGRVARTEGGLNGVRDTVIHETTGISAISGRVAKTEQSLHDATASLLSQFGQTDHRLRELDKQIRELELEIKRIKPQKSG